MDTCIIPRPEDDFTIYEATPITKKGVRITSIVWEHFDKIKDEIDGVWKTQCKHCKQIYSSAQKNGTSHLKRHLDRCHKIGSAALSSSTRSTPSTKAVIFKHDTTNKRSRSIWKVREDFEELEAERDDIWKARCRHCKQVLSGASKYGTSHLKRHLSRCKNHDVRQLHLSSKACEIKHLLPSNEVLVDKRIPPKKCRFDHNETLKAISTFVVCGNHPFTVVQEVGFKHLMRAVCPEYENLSPLSIRKDTISSYLKLRDNLQELFGKSSGKICLLCGNWGSSYGKDEYLCITAHFITNDWKPVKKIIHFKPLAPPIDGISVANEVALCLSMWKIDSKVFSITSDSTPYNESMVSSLKRFFLAKKNLFCDGTFFQVYCCSHILNLIVQATLNHCHEVIDKIRSGAKHVKKSTSRKKFYEFAALEFQLDTKKRIHSDLPFKWNTTYMMIDHALYYRRVLESWGEDCSFKQYSLSEEEWENVATLQKFLSVFYDVVCSFSAVKHPTSNLYFRALWKIYLHLLKAAQGPVSFMTNMVKDFQEQFEKYWKKCNLVLSCAAVLDPRYKVKLIEYCYTKVYGDRAEEFVNATMKTLYNCFDEYKPNSFRNCATACAPSVFRNEEDKNENGDEFEDYELFLSRRSRPQGEKSQLDLFLEEPNHDLNSELDVLEYWIKSSVRYPELAMMARDILLVPISSVSSEESFSLGKKILNPTQCSLNPKMLQALICLSDWTNSALDSSTSSTMGHGTCLSVLQEYDDPTASDDEYYHDDWDTT